MTQSIEDLSEYIENDEYGEYLTGLIDFYSVVEYSGNIELINIIKDTISKELEYCRENFDIVYRKEVHTIKEIVEKGRTIANF